MKLVAVLVVMVLLLGGCANESDERAEGTATESSSPVPQAISPTEPSPDDASSANTARIACTEAGVEVLTPTVTAQSDGVHFVVTNATQRNLSLVLELPTGGSIGQAAPSTFTVEAPVGTLRVLCYDAQTDEKSNPAQLEVVDPEGIYRSPALASRCAESSTLWADYAPDAKGERGTPVEIAKHYLQRRSALRTGDVVERAGYPSAETATIRVVRRGDTVAIIQLLDDGTGGWLFGSITACSGEGFD